MEVSDRGTRWINQIRPVPGGALFKAFIVVLFLFFFISDLFLGTVNLGTARGWVELFLPYLPLLLLIAGTLPGIISWLVVFLVIIGMGATMSVLAAFAVATLIVSAIATATLPRAAGAFYTGLTFALFLVCTLTSPDTAPMVALLALLTVLAVAAGFGLGAFWTKAERSEQRVSELREAQLKVREQERTLLAHELHDIVAHEVTIIAMQARRAEFTNDPEKTSRILSEIGDAASQTLQDLRSLVLLLKEHESDKQHDILDSTDEEQHFTPSGETTNATALVHDVRHVADAIERSGYQVLLEIEGPVSVLATSLCQVLRRTVREIGTNVLKYADPAEQVSLRLTVRGGQVTLSSRNAVSKERRLTSSGTGLEAMRTRCKVFGGTLNTHTEDGFWSVAITLPFKEQSLDPANQGAIS